MSFDLETRHFPVRPGHADFISTTDLYYYCGDGYFEVRGPSDESPLLKYPFCEGVVEYLAFIDASGELAGAFLLARQLKIFNKHGEQIFNIEHEYHHHFVDKPSATIYFAGRKDVIGFDLRTRQFSDPLIGAKGASGRFMVSGSYVALFAETSVRIMNLETQMHFETLELGSEIACWAFRSPTESSSRALLAIGCSRGLVTAFTFKPNGQLEFKRQKKWHAGGVACLAISSEREVVYSGGSEAVVVIWELSTDRLDFIPRLGAALCGIALSDRDDLLLISTHNGRLFLKHASNFATVAEQLSIWHAFGPKSQSVMSSGFLCKIDEANKLRISAFSPREGRFETREVNPTERNFTPALGDLNGQLKNRYRLDQACLSLDGCVLCTAESFGFGSKCLFTKLKFFIAKEGVPTFELMSKFENPHLDEQVISIHSVYNSDSRGPLIRECVFYAKRGALQGVAFGKQPKR